MDLLRKLVKKQLQKQFEKQLKEIVEKEDIIRWAKSKTYTEIINEQLQKKLKNNERRKNVFKFKSIN
jgi:hypothetical protein